MKKRICFLLFILFYNLTLYGQFSFGPQIGVGLSNFHYTKMQEPNSVNRNDKAEVYHPILTPQIGLVLNYDFGQILSIRPELLYTQRGYKGSSTIYADTVNQTCRISYLELPVNIVLHAPVGAGKIEIFAGPSLAYGLSGKLKSEQNDVSNNAAVKFNKQPSSLPANTVYFNRLNVSLNVGVGYKIRGVTIQFAYNLGLSSLNPHYEDSMKESQRNQSLVKKASALTIGVVYLFNLKKKERDEDK